MRTIGVVVALLLAISSAVRAQSPPDPWDEEPAVYNMTDRFAGSLGLMVPVLLDRRTVVLFFAHITLEEKPPRTPMERGLQLLVFVLDDREACRSEILVDEKHRGRVLDEALANYKSFRLSTSTVVEESTIKRLARARDVELRVCKREYTLDSDTIEVLNRFATQVLKRKAPKAKRPAKKAVH